MEEREIHGQSPVVRGVLPTRFKILERLFRKRLTDPGSISVKDRNLLWGRELGRNLRIEATRQSPLTVVHIKHVVVIQLVLQNHTGQSRREFSRREIFPSRFIHARIIDFVVLPPDLSN